MIDGAIFDALMVMSTIVRTERNCDAFRWDQLSYIHGHSMALLLSEFRDR